MKWRKNSCSTKIETKIVEHPPSTKENVVSNSACVINHNTNQKDRKRKLNVASANVDTVRMAVAPKKQRHSEKRPKASIRFDYSLGHFPQIDKTRNVRCKDEECDKKTFVLCPICDVHLCLNVIENRNCFSKFHSKNK